MNVEYQSPDGRRRSELTATAVHQSFRDAEEQRVAVVRRLETNAWTNVLLASSDNDLTARRSCCCW